MKIAVLQKTGLLVSVIFVGLSLATSVTASAGLADAKDRYKVERMESGRKNVEEKLNKMSASNWEFLAIDRLGESRNVLLVFKTPATQKYAYRVLRIEGGRVNVEEKINEMSATNWTFISLDRLGDGRRVLLIFRTPKK